MFLDQKEKNINKIRGLSTLLIVTALCVASFLIVLIANAQEVAEDSCDADTVADNLPSGSTMFVDQDTLSSVTILLQRREIVDITVNACSGNYDFGTSTMVNFNCQGSGQSFLGESTRTNVSVTGVGIYDNLNFPFVNYIEATNGFFMASSTDNNETFIRSESGNPCVNYTAVPQGGTTDVNFTAFRGSAIPVGQSEWTGTIMVG